MYQSFAQFIILKLVARSAEYFENMLKIVAAKNSMRHENIKSQPCKH